jgi:hypothetical protein
MQLQYSSDGLAIHLFDNYVMNTFLAWEPRSHESRRNAIGSRFMETRLPGQECIHDVIIEKVYSVFYIFVCKHKKPSERHLHNLVFT